MSGDIGHGTSLAGATHGDVALIQSIGGSDSTRASVDVTNFDSTSKWMEFIPGLLDGGEITCELLYDETVYDALDTRLVAAAEVWTITFPDASTFVATGFITALGKPSAGTGDALTFNLTIKITGVPVYTHVS